MYADTLFVPGNILLTGSVIKLKFQNKFISKHL